MSKRYVVVIAGGTASGKSTFVDQLLNKFSGKVAALRLDSYYKDQAEMSFEQRAAINYDHPDSLDFELIEKHLKQLCAGNSVSAPVYDFSKCTRDLTQTEAISPANLIVVEGILALAKSGLRDLADCRIFVDAPPQVRFARRLERDVRERGRTAESVRTQWDATVEPMYSALCAPTREFADIVVDGTRPFDKVLDHLSGLFQI